MTEQLPDPQGQSAPAVPDATSRHLTMLGKGLAAAIPLTALVVVLLDSAIGQLGLLLLVACGVAGLFGTLWEPVTVPLHRIALFLLPVAAMLIVLLAFLFVLSIRSDGHPGRQVRQCIATEAAHGKHNAAAKREGRSTSKAARRQAMVPSGTGHRPSVASQPSREVQRVRAIRIPRVRKTHDTAAGGDDGGTIAPADSVPPTFHPSIGAADETTTAPATTVDGGGTESSAASPQTSSGSSSITPTGVAPPQPQTTSSAGNDAAGGTEAPPDNAPEAPR